ncbi:MAG: 23S rRNA (guanosine(2251)-2'-O)-methyltransferase RlmB [Cytophagales bacterium CG12_big_fil_rev_8_21_14_0_65_40_12]|nr:MAG: 23S rRNA (guanosine(2251)-2'-O)-methyltransferase RlmB [Cytophagales bacterium CG12_big_fil_rev_8_21_14_0_65_40_12]PIW04783.1 MAG: 23S rRNA (guanosine(2251)-2'-O)-methyltransferase RlmB [Cytophagales bacterium CG17_big_fil_post_rev_8_21_14_2_50_40_13]
MINTTPSEDFIYGSRAIIEAIHAGKEIDKLLLQKDVRNDLTTELLEAARDFNIPIQKVPIEKLNRITRKNHQGSIAFISSVVYASLDNIISEAYRKAEVPLLIVLDRITDVRNFGAIARTAECVGAHGIVIPSRGSAQVGSDAMKTSAGALNYIPVCRADNLKTTLREIKDNGITIIACTEKATDMVYTQDLTVPVALLMGSEEDGISPEYMKFADHLCKLPIIGKIESLNVSVATSVILYEAIRQRNGI